MDDLHSLRLCAWDVASSERAALLAVQEAAATHNSGAAMVNSCQRIEVLHNVACACDAPLQLAGLEALTRFAELAAGLHSVVMGEDQILGQVRAALEGASPRLRKPAAIAIGAARTLRAEAGFAADSGQMLDLALAHLQSGLPESVLVVGAGPVGRLVADHARRLGVERVTIAGRRNPVDAPLTGVAFVPLRAIAASTAVDIVVTALGPAADPLGRGDLPQARVAIVDLGTPRNTVGQFGAPVLTIARLRDHANEHPPAQFDALRERLDGILAARLESAATTSRSPIGRVRNDAEAIRRAEVQRIARLHPELPAEAVETITRSLINQLFHRPTERLRSARDPERASWFASLFAAEPNLREAHE